MSSFLNGPSPTESKNIELSDDLLEVRFVRVAFVFKSFTFNIKL